MAKYADYSIRVISENTSSLGRVPYVFYQPYGAGLKTGVPYVLTINQKEED